MARRLAVNWPIAGQGRFALVDRFIASTATSLLQLATGLKSWQCSSHSFGTSRTLEKGGGTLSRPKASQSLSAAAVLPMETDVCRLPMPKRLTLRCEAHQVAATAASDAQED